MRFFSCPPRPSVPLCNSRLRAASLRCVSSATRRTKRTKVLSSLGDASFDFLKGRGGNNDDADDGSNKEEDGGPSLVPLDTNSTSLLQAAESSSGEEGEGYDAEGLFGPLALLAVGLSPGALAALAALLEDDLGAKGVVPSFVATEKMLLGDLRSAFEEAVSGSSREELCLFENASSSSNTFAAPRAAVERPAVVLSGMSSPEVVSIVSAWNDSGNSERHSEVLFCAAVPANWTNRSVGKLVEDIAGDAASVEGVER